SAAMNEALTVLVTDIKQWAYCPRIVYYRAVLGLQSRPTFKMLEGRQAQEDLEKLELRRSLKRYGLQQATRHLGVWLHDPGLPLAGRIDMLLQGPELGAVVDFKLTAEDPRESHHLQLAAYALLAERVLGLQVPLGFLYRIPDGRVFAIQITAELRERVHQILAAIGEVVNRQWCPPPTQHRGRCTECEYANFCADIW
ncbi:MAG: CRISPR-associated protein Cas4, partial [Bryobacteraceae bacterium]